MIKLKTSAEIETLRVGGRHLAQILHQLAKEVKPGVLTSELDDLAQSLIKEIGAKPAFLNYKPAGSRLAYPAALCVSVNEEIVHGIPKKRVIKEGDVVTLDSGLIYQGLITDSAITVTVGKVSDKILNLVEKTKESLALAIDQVKPGARLGDIGFAVEQHIKQAGLGLVRDLAGHGVGYLVHEDPLVPNYGKRGQGQVLEAGLVIAIEPMVTLGSGRTKLLNDGFTFVTADDSMSAHFEHTVAVTNQGVLILTNL